MRIKANTPKGGYWPPLDAQPCLNISLEMQEKLNMEELLLKLERLSRENERLKGILLAHGISYEQNPLTKDEKVCTVSPNADNHVSLSKEQILQQRKDLFRSLFKGREDVFALRWESRDRSKSGYMPACSNRWTPLCDRKVSVSTFA